MIDKKVVPEGMLDAAMRASMEAGLGIGPSTELRVVLEAALRWQKENPPVPTDDFVEEVIREHSRTNVKWSCVEWVRRMYDAPEPVISAPCPRCGQQMPPGSLWPGDYVLKNIQVPEPEVPDLRILNAVQDLIDRVPNDDIAQRCIMTSFRRGQKAGSKE